MLIRKPKVEILPNKNKDKIKQVIKNMPASPGIYFMKNYKNQIIYIGKSKHLKNRVMSYFYNLDNRSNKIEKMISQINHIEIKLTETELDALILECRYIKKIKPPYNTLLKSPQKYCYIQMVNNGYSYLKISNDKEEDNSIYFGPYFSKSMAQNIIDYINSNYKVKCCAKKYSSKNSTCLKYHLKNCTGSCSIKYEEKEYIKSIKDISKLLNGKVEDDIKKLHNKMMDASMNLEFEKANECKILIEGLKYIQINQSLINDALKLKNIIAYEDINEELRKIFYIKGNKLLYSESINQNHINEESLIEKITYNINEHFFDYEKKQQNIEKEDLDEINIVYNYLNKNNLPYIEIKDELLINNDKLQDKLKIFVKA